MSVAVEAALPDGERVTAEHVRALEAGIERLDRELADVKRKLPDERTTILVISGEMERVHTAFMLAHASAALGLETSMYFAMWGVQALRRKPRSAGKSFIGRCLAKLLAPDVTRLPSGHLNYAGLGPRLFGKIMRDKSVQNAVELLELAPECGIELVVCPLSLDMFEIGHDELLPQLEVRGAASFLEQAQRSRFSCVF